MKSVVYLFVLFISLTGQAQKVKKYDIQNLNAKLIINPYQKQVNGQLTYQIKIKENTGNIQFDAPGIKTLKVKTGCFKSVFNQTDKLLIINKKFKKGRVYKIKITYQANPKKALYFTGWQHGGRKQIWTQGQGKNNSHWLPTNNDQNDKFTWTLHIAFPKDYQVISNGILTGKSPKNDSLDIYTFRQDLPAPAYLIFIGAGQYIENKVFSGSKIPVYNYQYPDISNDKTYYKSQEIFDFIEQEIGVKYPWKNYKQIPCRDFLYGGMENVSATSFNGDRYIVDSIAFNDDNFVNVSAHELTHQWFGDLVTGKSSADHWLHEGFATYYARLNDAHIFGKDYNDFNVYQYDRQIIAAQNQDTIPLHRPNASSLTYYQKGAKIVSMLRQEIGDNNYRKLIKRFLTQYAYRNAAISDFRKELYEVTGDSLNNFFKLWFEQTNIPKFVIKQQNDSLIFIQNTHHLPLEFQIITQDSTYNISKTNSFKLVDYQHIKTVITNPDNQKLYDIQFDKNHKWLRYQILNAPNFIDRYKVLNKIMTWNEHSKDSIYNQLIQQNNYYPVYGQILSEIRNNLNPSHTNFIKKLFQKDLKTRQQIAIKIAKIPKELKDEYKTLLKDASYLTKRMALWHYWTNFTDEQTVVLEQTKNLKTDRLKYFRLMWLSLALITPHYQEAKKPNFLKEIISYASPQYNMLVRLNAFEMIDALQLITSQSIDYVTDAAFHFNWRLHQPARQLLKKWAQNPSFKNLILMQIDSLPTTRKEIIRKWIN